VSLESYLEDLQIHISQDLANSEAFANDRTISASRSHLRPSALEMHARVRTIAPKVRSIALGQPGNAETLKLAYKFFLFFIVNTLGGAAESKNATFVVL
jgi:hypothetical protein